MNQILYTGGNQKRGEQKTAIKIFAIAIIIFAIALVGTGGYKLYNDYKVKQANSEKPVINVERKDETNIVITASHSKEITSIQYQWNEEAPITISGKGTAELRQEIQLPSGTNLLKITATDINGQTINYEKQYIAGNAPRIQMAQDGNNLKVKITSKEGLSYVTYRWDENEETKEEAQNATEKELTIEIPQGRHTLTIIAVDINNNTETKTQNVNAITKPNLQITTDGQHFVIKATDKENLQKLEYSLNGEPTKTVEIDGTEYNYTIPLIEGENKLIITVYNTNGLSFERKIKAIK